MKTALTEIAMKTTLKEIYELIKKGMTVEAQEKIMNMREHQVDLRDVILQLRQEIQRLRERLDLRDSVIWEHPFRWLNTKEGKKEGPYCPTCFETKDQLVHLIERDNGWMKCHSCKFNLPGPNYTEPNLEFTRGDFP